MINSTLTNFLSSARDWSDQGKLPGIRLILGNSQETLVDECLGMARLDGQTPINRDSLFRLASASKVFVSVACLRLVQQQQLKLHQPVATVLPEYQQLTVFNNQKEVVSAQNTMTIMDLLRHSCGYGYGDTEPYGSALREAGLLSEDVYGMNSWTHNFSLREWAERLAKVPLESEPGTATSYGLGHDLLGAVMEVVCGKPLDEILIEQLGPLQLMDTSFVVALARQVAMTDMCHFENDQLQVIDPGEHSVFLAPPQSYSGGGGWDMLGAGGLVSSGPDMAKLLRMIISGGTVDGEVFLKPELATLLHHSQTRQLIQPDIQPGCGYSLGAAAVDDPLAYFGKAPQGTLWWGGSTNTFYFYRPAETGGQQTSDDLFGVFLTQVLPFAQEQAIFKFERLAAIESDEHAHSK